MIRTEKTLPQADDNVTKAYFGRAMSLNDARDNINDDLSDLFSEAKSAGVPIPQLKEAVRIARMDADKRAKMRESDEIVEAILASVGIA